MKMRAYCSLAAALFVSAIALGEKVVQPGDVAFGLSTNSGSTTADQVRAGVKEGSWTKLAFMQSMEFDNADGIGHNAAGNLLALNFGSNKDAGGTLNQLSTDGTDNGTTFFNFGDKKYGLSSSRVGGLSVSPNNQYVAVHAYDLGTVIVLNYDAGSSIGSGTGASITGGQTTGVITTTAITQGTAWLDDNTILLCGLDGTDACLFTIDFTGGVVGTVTKVATIASGTSGSRFLEVEYNSAVAPYVFAAYGTVISGVTTNKIAIIDPSDWSTLKTLDLSTSQNTLREIALGPDLQLYSGQFAGSSNRPHIDVTNLDVAEPLGVIDAADIDALSDNSSANYYSGSVNASFNGLDVAFGAKAVLGACCLSETECSNLTEAQCTEQGGSYKGDGTSCTEGICLPPQGACCGELGACVVSTEADCIANGGSYQGDLTVCDPNSCPVSAEPVEGGDIAFGLSNADANSTLEHIRGGARIGKWSAYPYIQSVEFDNAGGNWHNARGNLLGFDFGSGSGVGLPPDCTLPPETDQGAILYNFSTDGSDAAEELYRFDTRVDGIACTRAGGIGVSADNKYVSAIGYDTGNLYVLEYDAGPNPGTGAGASITRAWEFSGSDGRESFAPLGATQGTTWLNDRTILALTIDPTPGVAQLWVVEFDPDAGTFTETNAATLFNVGAGSRYTDIEYNPNVAPYIFCMFSSFENSTTHNALTILGTDYSEKAYLEFNQDNGGVLQTAREISLAPDMRLYIAQFSGRIDTLTLDTNSDNVIDDTDIASLTNDSTVDYYASATSASFSGLDVAFEPTAGPCGGVIRGDSDGNGTVDFNDIDCFVAALISFEEWTNCGTKLSGETAFVCANDTDGLGTVDFNDIDSFVQCIINGTCD